MNWTNWLERWDRQQAGYLPDREARFEAMLAALSAHLQPDFVAIDLACGPGAISQRLLARFPQAHCIAIDLDPVLLRMGQTVLGDADGRLRWIEADLSRPEQLSEHLGQTPVDAVLSTTALHWLPGEALVRLYEYLAMRLRPGGLMLNGDNLAYPRHLPTFGRMNAALTDAMRTAAFSRPGVETWEQWWVALGQEPEAAALVAERDRRFANRLKHEREPDLEFHLAALRHAGFGEVGEIWRHLDNVVIMGVR